MPVPASQELFLLHGLQSGDQLLYKNTSKGLRGILHERFHPTGDASSFPEGRHGWLLHDGLKKIMDGVAGQRESWSVPFVVKFQFPATR